MFRIGCDVGGTNTDAAILDITRLSDSSRGVLATCKTPTTMNVTEGITTAISDVLKKTDVNVRNILNVAIGTTHFVNAIVESDTRHVSRVACVRLCGPYTRENPPFCDYPWALRELVEGPVYYLDGGLEIDGSEIVPLNERQIRDTTQSIVAAGISAVAVVGIFSALDHQNLHEERCRQIMLEVCPTLFVVCSHTIGGPGLLVRENATILNAAILKFARRTIEGFKRAISQLGLKCPLFLTQNDGTLIEASLAADLPVKTFASGPTNSLMGAAFLQGVESISRLGDKQLLVVDVGGTTTDICALLPSGFPRKAPNFVQIGGVRTEFSMPDVYSIGLGGGSRVRIGEDGVVHVGPDSVAHALTTDAMVFGGQTMTTSDIVVAAGLTSMGRPEKVAMISPEIISNARREMKAILLKAIDKMKVSNAPVCVLLVGGGSVIVSDGLDDKIECLRPPYHDSANAVGAAIAKVAGDVDTIEVLGHQDEHVVLEKIKQTAIATAIAKGADPYDVKVADISKLPLQYVTNKATRFIVKAVGSLSLNAVQLQVGADGAQELLENSPVIGAPAEKVYQPSKRGSLTTPTLDIDLNSYHPVIRNNVWHISPIDVELIAVGCGILGTGGGGSPYSESVYIFSLLNRAPQYPIHVVPPGSLDDNAICVFGSGFGAPSVSSERIDSGTHIFAAIDHLNRMMNIPDFHGIVAAEIGGGNGLVTFPSAAHYGRPVIDCDLMGRAYPTIEHCIPYLYGQPITPATIADTKGNVGVVLAAENYTKVEAMLRTTCIELGNHVGVTGRPLTGNVIKKYCVPNTVSQAWFLGRAVRLAQKTKVDFIQALQEVMPMKLIYEGKIVDVSRDVTRGYTVGKCVIAPLAPEEQKGSVENDNRPKGESRNLIIPFQNEYLAAYLVDAGLSDGSEDKGDKEFICTVPDLISILGQDGEAIGSPELRYGLQVKVIAMPAHPLWTTEEGLRVGGPDFFRLDTKWVSMGEYQVPQSVFDVYGEDGKKT